MTTHPLRVCFALIATAAAGSTYAQATKTAKSVGIGLTIYNQNFALVKDKRRIELGAGRNSVTVEDVAALIDPTSVHFKSLTAPNAVSVREQNYQYDLINPTTLLNKSVGKRVLLRQKLGNGQVNVLEGTIITPVSAMVAQTGDGGGGSSSVYSGLVIRTADGRLVLNPEGEISLMEMPSGLVPIPLLAWLVDCTQPGVHDAEISYITSGLTWKSDYVAILAADDKSVDVTGWVTLDNKSGTTYENASLQLVAGDVRRVPAETKGRALELARPSVRAAAPQFAEESLFEYHLYTLDGTTAVRQNEQKQMTLLSATKAPALKRFVYDGRQGFYGIGNPGYRPAENFDTSGNTKINVIVEIKNAKPAMGIALPKGKVRLYKADTRGALQFVGEDQIDHTPKDETVRLTVGNSFDVVGEHKRTDFKRISQREVEESFEITIRNHREEETTVTVREHFWADWKIGAKSAEYVKRDASTIEFTVKVPKDGESKVTYTVRTKWL